MNPPCDDFYDEMVSVYHLLFHDWEASIARQREIISRLLPPSSEIGPILDCACGIGTQALGLASAGFEIEGTDLSSAAIERAKKEAASRNLAIPFRVDDLRTLSTSPLDTFGAVLAFDNALPHLDSDEDIRQALTSMRARLRAGGKLLVSLRDYGPLMSERPATMTPTFAGEGEHQRIVHQIWEWKDERRYIVHIFISIKEPDNPWTTRHFAGRYRATTPKEIASNAEQVGFNQVEILEPAITGFYQPIVTAIR